MDLKLDHIVHFINRHPVDAVHVWRNQGYHAVMGGSHEHWGTSNSLLYLNSEYIEFLSVENESIANNSDNPLISQLVMDLPKGEGLGQICFRTTNIEVIKQQLEQKGFQTFPIFNGSRKRQDGMTIKWKMLFIKEDRMLLFPFFIEWEQTDIERYNDLRNLKMLDLKLEKHTIQSIYYAAKDCEQTAKEWSHLFQLPLIEAIFDSNRALKTMGVQIGSTKIYFCEPLIEKGLVYDTLKKRGERPFQVHIHPLLRKEPFSLFGSCYN